jgi:threonylcarbamoyladenosine tRNA methylthiotransferase MtaB
MKRKYNADMAMRAIRLLRERIPNVKFTTDVIVGFPGETEEDFEETVRFVREARFLMVHIFPYSRRRGTVAEKMPDQIPEEIKRDRLHRLEAVATEARAELLREAVEGSPLREVLFETYRDGVAYGHTDDFLEVALPSSCPLHGRTVALRLTHTDGQLCFAKLPE